MPVNCRCELITGVHRVQARSRAAAPPLSHRSHAVVEHIDPHARSGEFRITRVQNISFISIFIFRICNKILPKFSPKLPASSACLPRPRRGVRGHWASAGRLPTRHARTGPGRVGNLVAIHSRHIGFRRLPGRLDLWFPYTDSHWCRPEHHPPNFGAAPFSPD